MFFSSDSGIFSINFTLCSYDIWISGNFPAWSNRITGLQDMKTFTIQKCWLPILLLLLLTSATFLHAQTQPKRDDGNIRITVRKSVNGQVTYLEQNRYVRNEAEVNELLSEYGVDSRIDEMKPGEEIEIVLRRQKENEAEASPDPADLRPMLGVLYSVEYTTLGRVDRVYSNTGASRAGMKVGDVIVTIDGVAIHTGDQIRDLIAVHKPGDVVRIEYLRLGRKRETLATLGIWKDIPEEERNPTISPNWQFRYPDGGNFNSSLRGQAYLGVSTTGGSQSKGVYASEITEVIKGSPAAKAGIREGDRVLRIDSVIISSENTIPKVVSAHKPGDVIHLWIRKSCDVVEFEVTLADRYEIMRQQFPEWNPNVNVVRPQEEYKDQPWMGVQLRPGSSKGAEVESVYDESPSEALGLRPGDLIISVAGTAVTSADRLVDAVRMHTAGDVVVVEWIRNGVTRQGTCALSSKSRDYRTVTEWEEIRITIRKAEITEEEAAALAEKTGMDFSSQNSLEPESFEVYPNPSHGIFSLRIQLREPGQITLRVFDLSGRMVWNEMLSSEGGTFQPEINITHEPASSYYLVAEQNGKSYVKKLVVQ
jgi:S1-C subfamily serine protease